jgi:hypothetical protein
MLSRRHALFFKQDFVGGYRYLDRCGEFLARAEEEMEMMAGAEQTPSGGTLEKPEFGIKLEFNTLMFRLTQEFPESGDTEIFREHAEYFSGLYHELFLPKKVERNGVAVQCFLPFDAVDVAERASLVGDAEGMATLGVGLGMLPASRTREYRFISGSKSLRVKTHPATFERVQGVLKNVVSRATDRQKQVIARQNTGVKRILEQSLKHALFVDLDLTEDNPPENGIAPLIKEVFEKEAQTIRILHPSER